MQPKAQFPSSIRIPGAALAAALLAAAVPALGAPLPANGGASYSGVATATPRTAGAAAPNALSPELLEAAVVQGSQPLENPESPIAFYGYGDDGPMVPAPGDVQAADHRVEATKSEPDKNTYLVLGGTTGPDPEYDYGRRFLFQGHEGTVRDELGRGHGALTRVNLDADPAHRVTLLATTDVDGSPLPSFDGSTWNPFARRLLLTAEFGSTGGVWQATADYPSEVEDVSGALGRGGYEGIQTDDAGRVWIVEDVGGAKGAINSHARQPNSFVYRFVPESRRDLTQGGRLQALQVLSQASPGQPIRFHEGQADADILSQDVADLHTYGKVFAARWVTIHDTATDGDAPFDANALAKAAGATPFKRPENGQFRPGTGFGEFLFDETGDTDLRSEAGQAYGGFGGVFSLRRPAHHGQDWTLRLVYLGDAEHTGFDNCAFWTGHQIVFVEDGGDGLHEQRNAFDSAYLLDLNVDYAAPGTQPIRLLALGRDASATLDASLSGEPGFQNDGDNEITGIHVSNGDPGPGGLLGAALPHPFHAGWRVFYTQQHGDNTTYELLPSGAGRPGQGR